MPVYGVECYIGRCAESLMRQTYANIEYIFVDDCTPDSSIDVIRSVVEQYPDRKNNVRILCHDKNRGLAAVRNTAVSAATGAFVLHVDSDDWVEPDIVERLVEHQAATGADIVGCGHTVHRRGVETDRIETYDGNGRDLSQLMLGGEAMFYVWGRLIRRSLYTDNAVRCVEGANGSEDMLTVCKLTYYARRVSYIDAALYHYNLDNEGSFCHTFSEAKNMQDWVNRDELRRYFADKGSRYVEAIDRENRRYAARTILTAAAEPGHRAYIQVMRKRANVAIPPPRSDIHGVLRVVLLIRSYLLLRAYVAYLKASGLVRVWLKARFPWMLRLKYMLLRKPMPQQGMGKKVIYTLLSV